MKLIRVFPRQTKWTPIDDMAFVGDPPLDQPPADEVHVSCTFTWDIEEAKRLFAAWSQYYSVVKLGGPAFSSPCIDFVPGRYISHGVVFTSYGCNNKCPPCLAWRREGLLKELPIISAGPVLQDNNVLQCSGSHLDKVFSMLATQSMINLTGGIDSNLVTDRIADRIRGLRIDQVFLACDTKEAIKPLRKAIRLLNLPRNKVRSYALLKFNPSEAISEATDRMIEIWEAGAMPFAQLYQPPDKWIDYPKEWLHFQRTWQRPAAQWAFMKAGDKGKVCV